MSTHQGPHQAKKRFGQNFLHDAGVIEKILRVINPQRDDRVIEIGPGLGALTVPLLKKLDRLTVIELDRDIIPHLLRVTGNNPHLTIVQADALKVDYAQLAPSPLHRQLRLIGNLPYNISTPILFHLLQFADSILDMHFMLQKEVVERICAAPDSEHYGRLTVSIAARADAAHLFNVGSGAFTPAPQVDSAIVRLKPRPPAFDVRDWDHFDRVVMAAFGQRRKTLSNSLRSLLTAAQIEAAGISAKARAETVDAAGFARLANLL